jgi:DMSO reductase family type II enzyme heme b subunit
MQVMPMEAVKLQLANQTLLNPAAPQWQRAPEQRVALRGTEAHAQPSPYIRTVWAGKRIGVVRSLSLRAAHNRQSLFFRLEWVDPTHNPDHGDGSVFPDAAAVLFSSDDTPPLARMGAPGRPLEGWYWRADRMEHGESLRYEGLATEESLESPLVLTNASWQDGRWTVVIGAPVEAAATRVGFAVWDGGNQERAGLHSYSPEWLRLEVR